MKFLLPSLVFSTVVLSSVVASAQVKDQVFKDWTVYTTTLQGKKTCYMASRPKSEDGNYSRRDKPYLMVTRINNNLDEVSVSSGYSYKNGANIEVSIDSSKYEMFTKGEIAWASDSAKDAAIVESMKAKKNVTVKGVSNKGTYSIDKYSLSGFSAAYKRMKELCS